MQGFHEQAICFPPTFKFIPHSDDYNLKRIPSWTDRVLFLCNAPPSYCALRSAASREGGGEQGAVGFPACSISSTKYYFTE